MIMGGLRWTLAGALHSRRAQTARRSAPAASRVALAGGAGRAADRFRQRRRGLGRADAAERPHRGSGSDDPVLDGRHRAAVRRTRRCSRRCGSPDSSSASAASCCWCGPRFSSARDGRSSSASRRRSSRASGGRSVLVTRGGAGRRRMSSPLPPTRCCLAGWRCCSRAFCAVRRRTCAFNVRTATAIVYLTGVRLDRRLLRICIRVEAPAGRDGVTLCLRQPGDCRGCWARWCSASLSVRGSRSPEQSCCWVWRWSDDRRVRRLAGR